MDDAQRVEPGCIEPRTLDGPGGVRERRERRQGAEVLRQRLRRHPQLGRGALEIERPVDVEVDARDGVGGAKRDAELGEGGAVARVIVRDELVELGRGG